MHKRLLYSLVLAGWLVASAGQAQFGHVQNNAPANAQFLPRTGAPRFNSQQLNQFGYGNPLNNYFNQSFNIPGGGAAFGNPAFNSFATMPYGSQFNSPYGNPWQGNNFGGGFNNGFGGGYNNGFGYNPYQTPWGFGNMYSNSAPFGNYQYFGYGNYAPIVGLNNGWYPYQPAYNYNNPIDQYMQRLFISGLPAIPGGSTVLPR